MTLEEFKKQREEWIKEWFNNYRLLDIDFETFMVMNGMTPDLYKKLNEEESTLKNYDIKK
jgi:hypothetical protein